MFASKWCLIQQQKLKYESDYLYEAHQKEENSRYFKLLRYAESLIYGGYYEC